MSDIRLIAGKVAVLQRDAADLEKPLQTLIEGNLDAPPGIRFLVSEHAAGACIDSSGIDENNCPVIVEYKRSVGENEI